MNEFCGLAIEQDVDNSLDHREPNRELDIHNPDHRKQVALHLADGGVAGIQTVTNGLWVDTTNEDAYYRVNMIKERDSNSPLALIVPDLKDISSIVDLDRIDPALHEVFKDPQKLGARMSSRALLKFPVHRDATFNGHLLNRHIVADEKGWWLLAIHFGDQNPHAQALVEELYKKCGLIAATSMNKHNEKTIVEQEKAQQFCAENNLPYMPDKSMATSARKGSFPLMLVAKAGEFVPMQNVTLDAPAQLYRKNANLNNEHVYYLWPEVYDQQNKPFAEVVGKFAPAFFNLAANRSAGEMLQAAHTFGLLEVNPKVTAVPRPPLLRKGRPA